VPESFLQISAIPTGPFVYRPVTPVAPIAALKGSPADAADAGAKPRAVQAPGVGSLLDLQA